jgi:signal transduction histidine kinase
MSPGKASDAAQAPSADAPWFLREGGISGEAARAVDWASTPLGPPARWPSTLKTTVATMFRARQPMFLWWGPDLIQLYNDAYLPSFGTGKHPRAMGQRGRECWQEIWPIIGPQIDDVMERARSSYNEDALVPILRNGRLEEVYWNYTYSPVFQEDGAVGGTLVICTETTSRVLGERRANVLHALVAETSIATDRDTLWAKAFEVLGRATADLPTAALCERVAEQGALVTSASAGLSLEGAAALAPWLAATLPPRPLAAAVVVPVGAGAPAALQGGDAPRELCVLPLFPGESGRDAVLVFGLSGRLSFDDAYRRFLEQVAGSMRLAQTRLEEMARRARVELERLNEREGLLREVQQASRAKDEFLAMLGHELRNPLSPIVSALRLMRLKLDERALREHHIIERHVTHLVRLVDDLLDVAKIARGRVELRREVLDLADVVPKAVEMAGDLLERRHHRLTIDCEKRRYFCDADPTRLAQVFANLLTNAAKYTDPNGHIAVRVSQVGEEVVVTVTDDGIGLPAEMIPRVFDLFEQGERGVDRAMGGLGIGLALVKNLVAMHGGRVAVASEGPGRGSVFTVALPAVSGAALQKPGVLAARAGPGTGARRILVVDDNVDAAEILTESLQLEGHEVVMATEPLAALELAARFRPEIAVLDIGLPVMDGYELASRLHGVAGCADTRLIALTGYGQEHDKRRSREAGFHSHLVKPIEVDQLLALIDAANEPA